MLINIIIAILLVMCSFTDFKFKKVSLHLLIIFAIAALLFRIDKLYNYGFVEIKNIGIDILPGLILLLLGKATEEKIGYGDGYVFVVIGVYIGFSRTLGILITAFFIIFVISMFLLMIQKINSRTGIPFIPAVFISFLIQLFL